MGFATMPAGLISCLAVQFGFKLLLSYLQNAPLPHLIVNFLSEERDAIPKSIGCLRPAGHCGCSELYFASFQLLCQQGDRPAKEPIRYSMISAFVLAESGPVSLSISAVGFSDRMSAAIL